MIVVNHLGSSRSGKLLLRQGLTGQKKELLVWSSIIRVLVVVIVLSDRVEF